MTRRPRLGSVIRELRRLRRRPPRFPIRAVTERECAEHAAPLSSAILNVTPRGKRKP